MWGLEKARKDARLEGGHTGHTSSGVRAASPQTLPKGFTPSWGIRQGSTNKTGSASEKVVPSTLRKANGNSKMENIEFRGLLKTRN